MKHILSSVAMAGLLASTITLAHAEQPTPYVQTGPTQANTVENFQFKTSPVSDHSQDHRVNNGTQPTTVVAPFEGRGYVNTTENQYGQQQAEQQMAPMLTGADYFQLSKSELKLETISDRKYDGYELKLVNTQPYHVQIMSGQVTNALNEQQIAAESQFKKKKAFSMGKFALGAAGTALSMVPYAGGMSSGAYLATARATSAVSSAAHYTNQLSNNSDGSISITGAYVQQFKEVILGPNQEFRFQVIVPSGQQPNVQMVFKNLETNQILDVRQGI